VRLSLDVLAGVPSVFGLFGNAFFCKTLGMGFSILWRVDTSVHGSADSDSINAGGFEV